MPRSKQLNPLSVAFGNALRKIRKQQGRTTREIEDKNVGMSGSFYRLIESGRNNPSVSKASFLYHRFLHLQVEISYEALVFLISTIAASEEKVKKQKRLTRGQQLDENVRSIHSAIPVDHPFKILLDRFLDPLKDRGVICLDNDSNIFQAVDKNEKRLREIVSAARLDTEVFKILTSYKEYMPLAQASEAYALTYFDEIPSVYKSLLDGFKKNLAGMPKIFVPEGSWDWENENKDNFCELIAICRKDHLVAKENLRRYRFEYLWNEQFLKATFVLLDEKETENAKEQFWSNLKQVLNSDPSQKAQTLFKSCDESLERKTIFRKAGQEERTQLLSLLKKESPSEEFHLNAMWFFKTTDFAVVGMAAQLDDWNKKAAGIKFLSFGDCKRALSTIIKHNSENPL